MGKQLTAKELDAIAVKKAWELTHAPIRTDLDFIERMTFADRAWEAIYDREERKFVDIERREERIKALKEAIERFPKRDYDALRHLHFEEQELKKRAAAIKPVEETLDSIERAMIYVEAMAMRDLGYVPHDFFGD